MFRSIKQFFSLFSLLSITYSAFVGFPQELKLHKSFLRSNSMFSFAMAIDTIDILKEDTESNEQEHYLLEPPPEGSEGITKMVLGEKIGLDSLGPMVINKDGTVSRITNWDVKLPHEREAISRVIAKRNRERVKALSLNNEEGFYSATGEHAAIKDDDKKIISEEVSTEL